MVGQKNRSGRYPKPIDNPNYTKLLFGIVNGDDTLRKITGVNDYKQKMYIPNNQERKLLKKTSKQVSWLINNNFVEGIGETNNRTYKLNFSGIIEYICLNILTKEQLEKMLTEDKKSKIQFQQSGKNYIRHMKRNNKPEFLLESYLKKLITNRETYPKEFNFYYVRETYENISINKILIGFITAIGHYVYMNYHKKIHNYFMELCCLYYQKNNLNYLERIGLIVVDKIEKNKNKGYSERELEIANIFKSINKRGDKVGN